MTLLATGYPNSLDWAKRRDPNGRIAKIVELLDQTNDIEQDMYIKEANGTWSHRTTARVGLPSPTWLKFYGGVQPGKSQVAQVTSSMGRMASLVEVDKALADAEGDAAGFLSSETVAHAQGISQEIAQTLFYGSELTAPEEFSGFASHYNDTSAPNGENIIGEANPANPDSSDNTSIWLVGWGEEGTFGIVPRGMPGVVAGIKITDLDVDMVDNIDGAGGRMLAYRKYLERWLGLCVRDWRANVRIAINSEDLTSSESSGPKLIELMARAIELVPAHLFRTLNMRFYANRKVLTYLRLQIANKVANSTLTMDTVGGKRVMAFDSVPVRRCDAIHNAESDI